MGGLEGVGKGASANGDTASTGAALRRGMSGIGCDLSAGSSVAGGVFEIGKLDNGMPTRSRAFSSKTIPQLDRMTCSTIQRRVT